MCHRRTIRRAGRNLLEGLIVLNELFQRGIRRLTMSRFGGIKRKVFARHSNPWSAWTRWASTPLVFVPVWNRRWSQAALVAAWMAVNPIVFPVPRHNRAWSTRAVLGEELWITERPRDKAMAVNAAASVAGVTALVAAMKRRPTPAAVAIAAQMALTLGYWRLMAEYYERSQHDRDLSGK